MNKNDEIGRYGQLASKSKMRYLWIAGAGLYVAAIYFLGWRNIRDTVASIDPWMLLVTALIILTALWLRALKWRFMLGPNKNAIGLYFLSKAGGGMSPGRVGELAPLLLRGHRSARLGAWIITDRLLEIGATLGLGLVGLLALQIPTKRGMMIVFAAAACVLVIAPFLVLTREKVFLWVVGHTREGSPPWRIASLLASVSGEIRRLGKKIPVASALTLTSTALDICVSISLYLSFGHKVAFSLLAVVQCAHGLAGAVPITPNATGVPYLVAAGLLNQVGGVPKDVLAAAIGVSIAVTTFVFWTSFLFGASTLRKKPRIAQDQSELFDDLVSGGELYVYEPEALQRLRAFIPHEGHVLDVGCGDGAIGVALDGTWVAGFDISQRCASIAGKRGMKALVADATTQLPFKDGAFETVCCIDVLHHLHGHWDDILRELDRVLAKNGTIVVVEPDAQYAYVRWTQAPYSPIRVAPYANEPAIWSHEISERLEALGFVAACSPIRIIGRQVERNVFPVWQRLLKAPWIMLITFIHGNRPNKFAIKATRRSEQ